MNAALTVTRMDRTHGSSCGRTSGAFGRTERLVRAASGRMVRIHLSAADGVTWV